MATRKCISPWPQITTSWLSALWITVSEGSSSVILVKACAEFDVVLAFLACTAIASTGCVRRHAAKRAVDFLARRQSIAGLGGVELAESNRFARSGLGALVEMLAHQLEHGRGAAHLAGWDVV